MEKLEIKPSNETPHIVFDPSENLYTISGVCLPEDAKGFFAPVYEWIKTNGPLNSKKSDI